MVARVLVEGWKSDGGSWKRRGGEDGGRGMTIKSLFHAVI